MKSKFTINSAAKLLIFAPLLSSCGDLDVTDLLYMFDKKRDNAFITNETDCDVIIRRKYFYRSEDTDSLYRIPAGKELEIPITDRWNMAQHTQEFDTVFFNFADGTSYIHTAHAMRDIHGQDSIVYEPKDYNILKINNLSNKKEDNSWKYSKIKGRHYRYDFYITEKGK